MDATKITPIITPLLVEHGLELDGCDVVIAGKRSIVRITVDGDGPKGRGPLLDDISLASRAILDAFDASGVMGERSYTLEVSSRGTSRPLTKPAHWRRNTGRLVACTIDGEKITGRIIASDETGATIDIEGNHRRVDFADARKPIIQVELNRPHDPDLDDADGDIETIDEEN